MNLNTTKSMIFKGVHDQRGGERELETAKSNTGLSLAQSAKRHLLSFSLVRRPCSPLPHDNRRYRLMTISGKRTSTTAGPALQNFPHSEIQCPQWMNQTYNCPMSISKCPTMQSFRIVIHIYVCSYQYQNHEKQK